MLFLKTFKDAEFVVDGNALKVWHLPATSELLWLVCSIWREIACKLHFGS